MWVKSLSSVGSLRSNPAEYAPEMFSNISQRKASAVDLRRVVPTRGPGAVNDLRAVAGGGVVSGRSCFGPMLSKGRLR